MKTVEEKQKFAIELVHEIALRCSNIIAEAVSGLEGFENSEKFMTQQRIVNLIYINFNQIVFKAAIDLIEKDLK